MTPDLPDLPQSSEPGFFGGDGLIATAFMHGGGLIIGVFVVLVTLLTVVAARKAKRRREIIQGFASARGWQWQESDRALVNRWRGHPFGAGQNRRARNVLTGSHRSRQIAVFDYSYQTSHTDSNGHSHTTTHTFSVCAVQLPAPLPALEVGRETFVHRMARVLGATDLDFENEQFNRAFTVRAADRKFAYDMLHPRTMELLLARGTVPWRIQDDHLLCWAPGPYAPEQVIARLDLLSDLVDGVPSFVWADRR